MKVFDERDLHKHGLNYLNCKATLGKILSYDYDLVVNVDADHYFLDTCHEILRAEYDIACPANFNQTANLVGIKVSSGITGEANKQWLINETEFMQGGLIASTSKVFWEHYEYATLKYYNKFHCAENDVLNLVANLYPYKIKILDGSLDYRLPEKDCWYGCSIIGKEKDCYIGENGKVYLENKPVRAYHFAHGSAKKRYEDIFSPEVCNYIKTII
jgi:hypothetical protein